MWKQPSLLSAAALLAFFATPAATLGADAPVAEYLSTTLSDRLVSVTQGWGELGLDTAVKPLHKPAEKLRIKDRSYEHGIGHHAPGEIVVDLAGQFKTFHTDVGIQRQSGQKRASVIFRIFVDDKQVFESGVMGEDTPPRQVAVPVEGAGELRLVADDAGDGITCDCANWADARLVRDPRMIGKAAPEGVDIAPFGRVATWDPKQMKGTSAGRVQEIPANDLFPARDLLPGKDGSYTVPVTQGAGCIGLRWDENRLLRRLVLRFADSTSLPAEGSLQLQVWSGESAWQGQWQIVETRPEKIDGGLAWSLESKAFRRGTQKVRWIFADTKKPIVLKSLSAFTRSGWTTVKVRIESVKPQRGAKARIELYNGVILDPADAAPAADSPTVRTWDRGAPLVLTVRAALTKRYKADRTVLRFQLPDAAFGVATEDLVANDGVYVPHAGLWVTRDPAPVSLAEYLKTTAGRKTVLDQVREKPDQTFAQAMAVVHNPIQDLGPMMVSLACDNRKFVAYREGNVAFGVYSGPSDPPIPLPKQWQLATRLGSAAKPAVARYLAGAWLPMPVTRVNEGDVTYQQTTYVAPVGDAPAGSPAWLREKALAVVAYEAINRGGKAANVALAWSLTGEKQPPVEWKEVGQTWLASSRGRLLALVDIGPPAPLKVAVGQAGPVLSGSLAAGAGVHATVYIPAWNATADELTALAAKADWALRTEVYWKGLIAPSMRVEVPDPLLMNVICASQVHCLLAARNEDRGARVSPWISSDRYGPLESEANSIVRGMDMMGHPDFARRSLEYFIHRYNKAGYVTTGYTMVGTGEHLWTLGEHYQRTADRAWLGKLAQELSRVCQWVVRQRAKTQRVDVHGQKVPEYGLTPPGVTADWPRYAYRFFNEAQYCAGLEAAATALADVGHPKAAALAKEARQYREDLVRAYRWTQARSPVVRLDSGVWVPADVALLDCFGRVEDFLPGEDGNRSWCYSVEIGAHHLAANRILDPASPEVGWIVDYLEDVQFLRSGMGDYPEAKNRRDVFNFGGFAKVQPYYGRIAEVHALRDDVKPFLRSYFNAIPTLLSRENLSFWEHFHNRGGWNKTHETGWFLCQTRIMLVAERDDDLWLAPMVTNQWLRDGMRLAVRSAPTRFGQVGYVIESAAGQGKIDAVVHSPDRTPPQRIVLRLRHPEGKPMRAVTVNGRAHSDFDPIKETITLKPAAEPIRVRAQY